MKFIIRGSKKEPTEREFEWWLEPRDDGFVLWVREVATGEENIVMKFRDNWTYTRAVLTFDDIYGNKCEKIREE